MRRHRSLAALVGFAVLLGGFVLSSDTASAITASQANVGYGKCWQNGAGNCYHWERTTSGLSVPVERDVNGIWSAYFNQALADWTFTADPPLTPSGDSVSFTMRSQNAYSTSGNCAGIAGVSRVCNKKYGFNGWLGLATIWISSDSEHITAGTVKLNDSYFNTTTYNTAAWRNLVACQELAHTLGLHHQDETFENANLGSCMDYTNSPTTNQYPNSDDRLTLANMYLHPDSKTTAAASGVTGRNGAGQGQGQVLGDEDALPPNATPDMGDIFVRQLPNGQTLITHVFWVQRGDPGRP